MQTRHETGLPTALVCYFKDCMNSSSICFMLRLLVMSVLLELLMDWYWFLVCNDSYNVAASLFFWLYYLSCLFMFATVSC